jgi:acetyl-CoA carboxylase carboxyl transferase subunit alpha
MKHILEFEKPILELQKKLDELNEQAKKLGIEKFKDEIDSLEDKIAQERERIFKNLTPWQRVQLARHPQRPYTLDYVKSIFTDFSELHGDRLYAEDYAMVAALPVLMNIR